MGVFVTQFSILYLLSPLWQEGCNMHQKRYSEEGTGLSGAGAAQQEQRGGGVHVGFDACNFSCDSFQILQALWLAHVWVGLHIVAISDFALWVCERSCI